MQPALEVDASQRPNATPDGKDMSCILVKIIDFLALQGETFSYRILCAMYSVQCRTGRYQHEWHCPTARAGFDRLDTVPSTFVLMGNFQSQPATTGNTDYSVIKENFKALARIISQYQRLQVLLCYQKAITYQCFLPVI